MSNSITFPTDALVGSIGDLARTQGAGTEVPEEFYFATGLTMLGHVVGTRLTLDVGIAVEPRLYTVLLGESYSVKKSTAMKKTIRFFRRLSTPCNVVYGVGSAEGLARELERGFNSHLVLAFDELRALIDKSGVKGSTLMPMVTSLFEGNSWQNSVKSERQSVFIENAHLSVIGCCTRDTYEHIWKRDAIAIGLPNRLFIVNADQKPKVAIPPKADETRLEEIAARIERQLAKLPMQLSFSDGGRSKWEAWYVNLPASEHCRRLDTIGFRLLALMALTMDKEQIDAEVVRVVTSILDYEFTMRVLTDPVDADGTIARLEEKIRRNLKAKGPLTRRDLRRATHADRDGIWAFNQALDNLAKCKDIVAKDKRYQLSAAVISGQGGEAEAA